MGTERRKTEWSLDFGELRARVEDFVTETIGEPPETKRLSLREALAGAREATAAIDFSVGRASIQALPADSEDLFQAELDYVGDIDYAVSGTAQRVIRLRPRGSSLRHIARWQQDLRWRIKLSRKVPLRLRLQGGAGRADLDVSGLQLPELSLQAGVGEAAIRLPAPDEPLAASIKAGVGKIVIVIPQGLGGKLELHGGVGECAVVAAAGAALRLEATTGMGNITVPADFTRLDAGKAGGGLWQSAGYDAAARRLNITFRGGVGGFSLSREGRDAV